MENKIIKDYLVNEAIDVKEVRIVGGYEALQGKVVSLKEALSVANEENLDLVLMSKSDEVGICRVVDYSKFLYEMKKSKKPQKSQSLKELRFKSHIADHDLQIFANKAKKILSDGDKLKVVVTYQGRDITNISNGKGILEKFIDFLGLSVNITQKPKIEGKQYIMQLELQK